ncbi:hypothetical protein BZG36_01601 [Bifiguratus adelaidae]|uniref:Uncharacterized protein n=1 Tax=Bifiguratus adelaidae TaxID=1938954 RepID=A0A261Y4E9_9FUNG|nr:hypothetical protein BZG36_01601 [Bifiguratus adelaidae]
MTGATRPRRKKADYVRLLELEFEQKNAEKTRLIHTLQQRLKDAETENEKLKSLVLSLHRQIAGKRAGGDSLQVQPNALPVFAAAKQTVVRTLGGKFMAQYPLVY